MPFDRNEFISQIVRGSVFYFKIRDSDPYSHYFIVINKNPLSDDSLIMVIPASGVAIVKNRRRREPESTLVIIKKTEYTEFSEEESIVDCNVVHQRTVNEIANKAAMGLLKLKPKMDSAIIDKIRSGVSDSYIIPPLINGKLY